MTETLEPLIRRLEGTRTLEQRVALEALAEAPLDVEALLSRVRFSPRSWRATLLYAAGRFQLYAVGWMPSQRTTIHDHGGSRCAVRVLRGEATEVRFQIAPLSEGVRPAQLRAYLRGEAFGADDGVHLIANLCSEPLVTLHLYAPGLTLLRSYPWYGTQPVEGALAL